MKSKMLLCGVVFLAVVMSGLEGYASDKQAIVVQNAIKMFEGTYEKSEYSSWAQPQRCNITSDGTIMEWARITQKKPSWIGDLAVAESWTDAEGNTYCNVEVSYRNNGHNQALWKLDKTGRILEINYTQTVGDKFPENIEPNPDPNASPKLFYLIYYRQ